MQTIQGFQTIEVSAIISTEQIELKQPNEDSALTDIIQFPADRADAIIAAIKAAKKEINEAAKA